MKIKDIMTQRVEFVDPTLTIGKAAEKMRDLNIGFLPVCENGNVIGILTDRDITIRSVPQGRDPRLTPVSEIMSQQVFSCYDEEDIEQAAQYMQEEEVRRLVILDRDERLAGVVSLGDIAKAIGEQRLAGETLGHIAEAA